MAYRFVYYEVEFLKRLNKGMWDKEWIGLHALKYIVKIQAILKQHNFSAVSELYQYKPKVSKINYN